MSVSLSAVADAKGWTVAASRGRWFSPSATRLPLANWPQHEKLRAAAELVAELQAAGELPPDTGDSIHLSHDRSARLSPGEGRVLGLPDPQPFALRLDKTRSISDAEFRIDWGLLDGRGHRQHSVERVGSRITMMDGTGYRLTEPLWGILDLIDQVNAASGQGEHAMDQRMIAFARLKQRLSSVTGMACHADQYLEQLSIRHATAFGIDRRIQGDQQLFWPTLQGEIPIDPLAAENEDQEARHQRVLDSSMAASFERAFATNGARPHYALGTPRDRVYVVLDPPVRAALEVIARVNRSPPELRGRFRADPQSFLRPALEAAGASLDRLVELTGYGDRVTGVGVPEAGPGARPLGSFGAWLSDAQISGDAAADPPPEPAPPPKPPGADPTKPGGWKVLIGPDNLTQLEYRRQLRDRDQKLCAGVPPVRLRSQLKPHQIQGLDWLQRAWLSGMPGVLLADDMGLGKTLQVLAFLRWLKAHGRIGAGQPLLIVAPLVLLSTWREEIERHLGGGALGAGLEVHGAALKDLRDADARGNDLDLSHQTLDVERLRQMDWLLTTYETLRDYQMSFARIGYAALVFDEAQKLKTPGSMLTRAARALNGDFTIMMTGTPVENAALDLWSLLDVAWPGFLGEAQTPFQARYADPTPADRVQLRDRLIQPGAGASGGSHPPIMLRRFKADLAEALPACQVVPHVWAMPDRQVAAVDRVLRRVGAEPALTLLQRMRQVCLHPALEARDDQELAPEDDTIASSARFQATFRILDDCHRSGTAALVFLDLIVAQKALVRLVRARYRLTAPEPDLINGDTNTTLRSRIRTRFQEGSGFGVLVLGPKAAGFGLTLTRAQHVIHLNRWWNPAVEDQCSDRVYRIGQDKPVTIHLPIAEHPRLGPSSFDWRLHELLERKRRLSRDIVVPSAATQQELESLLRPDGPA